MIEFGRILREAREAKGLTISQIADKTHILSATIQALENEDFTKIPAPIYGRGFVKLYCEQVGLDPKPCISAFMDIYNGNCDPVIHERPIAGAPVTEVPVVEPSEAEQPVPVPSIAEPVPVQQELIPDPAVPPIAPPPPQPQQQPLSPPQRQFAFEAPIADETPRMQALDSEPKHGAEPKLSRYSPSLLSNFAPQRAWRAFHISVPPRVWRLGLVTVVGITLIVLICLGVRALYRATTPDVHETVEPDTLEAPAKVVPEKSAPAKPTPVKTAPVKTKRTMQVIPPLYLD